MSSSKSITRSLKKIKKEIDKTSDFIHVNSDKMPMQIVNVAIDKLHELKEMEFNIRKLM